VREAAPPAGLRAGAAVIAGGAKQSSDRAARNAGGSVGLNALSAQAAGRIAGAPVRT